METFTERQTRTEMENEKVRTNVSEFNNRNKDELN